MCAEQFGVIWAQYQRGPCPRSLTLSLFYLSFSLTRSSKFQSVYSANRDTRNGENKSRAPLDFSRRPRNAFLHRPAPIRAVSGRFTPPSYTYVIIYLYVRRTSSYVMCVCVCVHCLTKGNNFNFSPTYMCELCFCGNNTFIFFHPLPSWRALNFSSFSYIYICVSVLSREKLVSAHAHAHTHKWTTGGRAAKPCIKPYIYIYTIEETFNRARHTHTHTHTNVV